MFPLGIFVYPLRAFVEISLKTDLCLSIWIYLHGILCKTIFSNGFFSERATFYVTDQYYNLTIKTIFKWTEIHAPLVLSDYCIVWVWKNTDWLSVIHRTMLKLCLYLIYTIKSNFLATTFKGLIRPFYKLFSKV